MRISHEGFGGRASYGFDAVDGDFDGQDTAVRNSIAAGLTHTVAAGNGSVDERFLGSFDAGVHTISGVDASARTANGVWRLRVAGGSEYFEGYLDRWTLQF
ncbi:hypothetical protein [Kitasatospora sp. Root107]|uniref:hypothetical protein n=1 Tax=Kitasatospora sp. Root107 TaxID=1736424 RepID=UPI00070F63E8|nr:hypothetical protein [Kitasatospora sp. Root107]KQV15995.1 hypothetical protein ASC99_29095 [Kitasatospora sp. Root107]